MRIILCRCIHLRWAKLSDCVRLLSALMQRRLGFWFRGFDRVLHDILRRRRWFSRCRCARRCRCFHNVVNSSLRSSDGEHRSTLLGYYRRLLRLLYYATSFLVNADTWPNLLLLLLLLRVRLPLTGHRHSWPCDLTWHRALCRRLLRQNVRCLRYWRTCLELIILIWSWNAGVRHGDSRHHHLLESLQSSLLLLR